MTSNPSLPDCDSPAEVRAPSPRLAILVMLLGLLSPLALGVDALTGPYSSVQTPWSETIARRVEAHARSIPRPKIMFVGGSNMVFGVRPRALEADLGVPVVDYAVNAGIGFDVIADRAAALIRPGDVVVAAPEMAHFTSVGAIDPALRSDFARLFPPRHIRDPLFRFPMRQWTADRQRCRNLRAATESWWAAALMTRTLFQNPDSGDQPLSVYDLRAINAEGTVVYPRPGPAPWAEPRKFAAPWATREWYDLKDSTGTMGLRILATVCRNRRATFLIMPAVRTLGDAHDQPELEAQIEQREDEMLQLACRMGAHPLLGPGDIALPPRYAYDTIYHLNDEGAAIIHHRLVPALRPWVAAMPAGGGAPPPQGRGVSAPRSSTAPGDSTG